MAYTAYDKLSDASRIWIYRSPRELNGDEVINVNKWLHQFINQWTAHNQTLNAYASVYHNRFVVILLDEESSTSASGCSIDAQVHFIKEIERALHIDLFDRLHFDFKMDDGILSIHKDDVQSKISEGLLSESSLVFDHLVKSKADFENNWLKQLSQSWHARMI